MKKTGLVLAAVLAAVILLLSAAGGLAEGRNQYINSVNALGIISPTPANTSPHVHSWGGWTVVRKATCRGAGQEARTCSGCGEKQTRSIPIIPHEWGEWKITKASTCKTEGTREHTCKLCGSVQKQAMQTDPNAHKWGEWSVTKAATCQEEGSQVHACVLCGKKQTQKLQKTDHDWGDWIPLDPNAEGDTILCYKQCSVCGEKIEQEMSKDTVSAPSGVTPKIMPLGMPISLKVNPKDHPAELTKALEALESDNIMETFRFTAINAGKNPVSIENVVLIRADDSDDKYAHFYYPEGNFAPGKILDPGMDTELSVLTWIPKDDFKTGKFLRHLRVDGKVLIEGSDENYFTSGFADINVPLQIEYPIPDLKASFVLHVEDTSGMSASYPQKVPVNITIENTCDYYLDLEDYEVLSGNMGGKYVTETHPLKEVSGYYPYLKPHQSADVILMVPIMTQDTPFSCARRTIIFHYMPQYEKDGSFHDTGKVLEQYASFEIPMPGEEPGPVEKPAAPATDQPLFAIHVEDTSGMSGSLNDEIPVKITLKNIGQTVLRVSEIKPQQGYNGTDPTLDTLPGYTPNPMGFNPEQEETFTLHVKVTQKDVDETAILRNVQVTCASIDFSPENYLKDLPGGYVSQGASFSIPLAAPPEKPETPTPEKPEPPAPPEIEEAGALRLIMTPQYASSPTYPLDSSDKTQPFPFNAKVINVSSFPVDFVYLSLHRSPMDAIGEDAYVASPGIYLEPGENCEFPVTVTLNKGDIIPGSASETIDGLIQIAFKAYGAEPGADDNIVAESNFCEFEYKIKNEHPVPGPDPDPTTGEVMPLLQAVQISPVKAEYEDGDVVVIDWMLTNQGPVDALDRFISYSDTFETEKPNIQEDAPLPLLAYGANCAYGTTYVTLDKNRAVDGEIGLEFGAACKSSVTMIRIPASTVTFTFPLKKEKKLTFTDWTPPEVPDPAQGPERCIRVMTAQGEGHAEYETTYCRVHAAAESKAKELLANAGTQQEKLNAWHQAQELWKENVSKEYDTLIAHLPEEARSIAARERMAYFAWLTTHESALAAEQQNDPVKAAETVCRMLADRCTQMCAANAEEKAEQPAPAQVEIAAGDRCVHQIAPTGDGSRFTETLCAAHRKTQSAADALVARDGGDPVQAWIRVQMQWIVELDSLTNAHYLAASPAGRQAVSADRIAFGSYLELRSALLSALYPDDPAEAGRQMAEMIRSRITGLCGD